MCQQKNNFSLLTFASDSDGEVHSVNYRVVRSAPAHTQYFQPVFGTFSYHKRDNTEMITRFDLEEAAADEATAASPGLNDVKFELHFDLFSQKCWQILTSTRGAKSAPTRERALKAKNTFL